MSAIEVSAFRHPDIRVCMEVQLVLKAVDIDSGIERTEHGFAIYVRESDFAEAREQIALYAAENSAAPPPRRQPRTPLPWRLAVIACLAPLWLMALIAEQHVGGFDWYRAGRVDGIRIFEGEWWRLATALTLHADLGHLLANLASAAVVVTVAARQMGGGVTALALLAAGFAGNAVNLVFQGPTHLSVGASTAIFAGVGLAGVVETVRYGWTRLDWATRIGPLVLAVVVLTYFGTGGERTDTGAHWWGFVCGALVGLAIGRVPFAQLARVPIQTGAGTLALALLALAWVIALA
ncbi:MAG: rhomboid family intramembrane serine protease [Pseudomonadota bacterium]